MPEPNFEKYITFVVPAGYGCDPETYKTGYMKKAAELCWQYKDSVLVPCGGFTDPIGSPGKSEAGVMAEVFQEIMTSVPSVTIPILKEEGSITTLQNIKFAIKTIQEYCQQNNVGIDRIIFLFDELRNWWLGGAEWLTERIVPRGTLYEVVTHDLGNRTLKRVLMRRYLGGIKNAVCHWIPIIEMMIVAQRKHSWGLNKPA